MRFSCGKKQKNQVSFWTERKQLRCCYVCYLCFFVFLCACVFYLRRAYYSRQHRQCIKQAMSRNSNESHLESDKRNTAGFDFCHAPAPAEAVQFSVGLEGYLGQSSVLRAVNMDHEPVNSRWWQKRGHRLPNYKTPAHDLTTPTRGCEAPS